MNRLPADIEVLEPRPGTFRETRYRLPARTHEAVRQNFRNALILALAFALLPIGFALLGSWAAFESHEWHESVLLPLGFFGSFLFPLSALMLTAAIVHRWTRKTISFGSEQLYVLNHLGPFRWTNRYPLARLKGFRVLTGRLYVANVAGSQPFDCQSDFRDVGTLFADYDHRHPKMICSGYDPEWLLSLAHELVRGSDLFADGHHCLMVTATQEDPAIIEPRPEQPTTSDAIIHRKGDDVVIKYPPRGWFRALDRSVQMFFVLFNGFLLFCTACYLPALFSGEVEWENSSERVPVWLGLLITSPFYFIGMCFLATWYAYARYTARWEVSGKELRFWDRQLFGERTLVWQRSELQSVRVCSRQTNAEQDMWSTCLQIKSANRPLKEFREREKTEQEWLATTLSKALGLPL